jgi:hypothetical protein
LRAVELLVATDRLAIDPRQPVDLALALLALKERKNSMLLMQLQDVHSQDPPW